MANLSIELRVTQKEDGPTLVATYVNGGSAPLALTFWWNKQLRVIDAAGNVVTPAQGPVLPCGVAEMWTELAPGARHEDAQSLACTQPAGRTETIGWSYELAPGTYRVTLVYEAPPKHGFTQSEPHANAFTGRVESNEVSLVIPEKKGFFAKLFGR